MPAIAKAAMGSAQDHPSKLFSKSPMSKTAERYVHNSVCFESATAESEPSSRPARRCTKESTGMITRLAAAKSMPTNECCASPNPNRDRVASIVTYVARPKNEKAMMRNATFSRASGSRPANCHATAAADDTSMTESSPKPISAVEETRAPSERAMIASTTLYEIVAASNH
jgi:hypothetical protein